MGLITIAVTGHRPNKLGGYDDYHPIRVAIRKKMTEELMRWKGVLAIEAITGMALGVDQDFANVCIKLGIHFDAYIPFEGQEKAWPTKSQNTYKDLLSKASSIINTELSSPLNGLRHYSAISSLMQHRNEKMVDACSELLAFWDGTSGGTANCVSYAQAKKERHGLYPHIQIFDPNKLV